MDLETFDSNAIKGLAWTKGEGWWMKTSRRQAQCRGLALDDLTDFFISSDVKETKKIKN